MIKLLLISLIISNILSKSLSSGVFPDVTIAKRDALCDFALLKEKLKNEK